MTTCVSHRMRSPWRAWGIAALVAAGLFAGDALAATLSGQLTQTGQGHGSFFLFVVRLSITSPVAGTATLAAPGTWEVRGVPNGSYFILAFRDENGNLLPSRGEPMGFYGSPFPFSVQVSGNDVSGLNINLNTFAFTAELDGRVTYGGSKTGRVWIVPHTTPTLSLGDTRGTPWTMTSPGDYQVFVFVDGTYYITAYMDVNGNLIYDPGEPVGTSDPVNVFVTPGATYQNVDITIQDVGVAVQQTTWSQVKMLYTR